MRVPKVSIIIPSYNSSKYVLQCLKSIKAQTFSEWETIIVDDCSSDNSLAIITDYIKEDCRFQLLRNKTNSGPMFSRQRACNEASAEFITFIDSDDYFPNDAIEHLYNNIKNSNADIVEGAVSFVLNNKIINTAYPHNRLLKRDNVIKAFLLGHFTGGLPGKIYKSILFKENNYIINYGQRNSEDSLLTAQILTNVSKIVGTNKIVYSYRQNDLSITHNLNDKDIQDKIKTIEFIFNKYSCIQKYYNYALHGALSSIGGMMYRGIHTRKIIESTKTLDIKSLFACKSNILLSFNTKVYFSYFLFHFRSLRHLISKNNNSLL